MKLFRFTLGADEMMAVFEDGIQAWDKRAEVNPVFAYTPVDIKEVTVPGYRIEAYVEEIKPPTLDEIREALKEKGVRFPPNTGEARLRELADEHLC